MPGFAKGISDAERRLLRLCLGLAVAGGCLLAAAAAAANYPSTKPALIVPFRSIGGVKVGESMATARKAWGKPSSCVPTESCSYVGRNGQAGFSIQSSRVDALYIEINLNNFKHLSWKTPLTAFRTAKGIGLGSTLAQAKKAYPHLRFALGTYQLNGPKHSTMSIEFENGRAAEIEIGG